VADLAGGDPKTDDRRRFLDAVLTFGFVSTAVAVAYPVARYLVPPASEEPGAVSAVAAKAAAVGPNSGIVFRFGNKPGILVRDRAGDLHAFDAVCPHLGCTVQYRPETSDIWCACHNAVFDVGGNIVSGPPPRPLERLTVNVSGEDLVVSRG
jgi:cytochrome b6-f complex iron-sulfur subunit